MVKTRRTRACSTIGILLLLALSTVQPSPTAAEAALPPVTAFSAGSSSTCAVVDGAIWCWGDNSSGQLGSGSLVSRSLPAAVSGFTGTPVSVAVGQAHACALNSLGAVYCWGSNLAGELGVGNLDLASSSTPLPVTGLSGGVAALAAGGRHTCALMTGGTILCWGHGGFGQLGTGTRDNSPVPAAVKDLSGAALVSAGARHTCAAAGEKTWCWGDNGFGQLGDGSLSERLLPVEVNGLPGGAAEISAGGLHTCALAGGAAWCWGHNYYGQVGTGTRDFRTLPTPVTGLEAGVTHIRAGGYHTCALVGSDAWCWGRNHYGQLGNGLLEDLLLPGALDGIAGITAFELGEAHTCALSVGSLWCWGANPLGMLGDGVILRQLQPVQINTLGATSLLAAGGGSCAVDGGGVLWCWGANHRGQVGSGSGAALIPSPEIVNGLTSPVRSAAVGQRHACAVSAPGGALCWGDNDYGQLGDATSMENRVPTPVYGLGSGVRQVAAGSNFSCALKEGGAVQCWGAAARGQVGSGEWAELFTVPQDVVGLSAGVKAVAAGAEHACAVRADDSLVCWGDNTAGQLGSADPLPQNSPVPVTGLSQVAALAAGDRHTCAVGAAGAVFCWGSNASGQLGSEGGDSSTPRLVSGLESGMAAVSAGAQFSCALSTAGTAWCWGLNDSGQLGIGSTASQPLPVQVPGLSGVLGLVAGEAHACARTGLDVRCWGSNASAQLGEGSALLRPLAYRANGLEGAPALGVNYTGGAPGSLLRFVGTGFAPGSRVDVWAGGRVVGSVAADEFGSYVFNLLTSTAAEGVYSLEARQDSQVGSQVITLNVAATLRQREGAAPCLRLASAVVHLPLVSK